MSSSAVVTTTSDNTGIQVVSRDRDAANMYIHNERPDSGPHTDRELSPVNSFGRSASIDSVASISQTTPQTSCATLSSMDEAPTKKRRKQSNPVRYGQTSQTNILPMPIDEDIAEEEDEESLMATGLRVSSQLQRSTSFSSSDEDSNIDEDIDEEQALELDRSRKVSQQLLQQSVMNFHKFQLFCPHCKCPFNNDDDLRSHIEEEHVQKLLERQLFQHQQQQQLNHKSSALNGPNQLRASLSDICKYDQIQHKYNSSDSQTSSSSGSNNNSPLQSPLNPKSFDASLPHGSSDPTVKEFGKEFGSNFLPFQMPPNMPPLIPMSQSSGAPVGSGSSGEGIKSGNQSSSPGAAPLQLAMFPNPMAPFLFPIPMGTNSGSNGSAMSAGMANGGQQVSSGGVRIFNPEAYCELCNKEFCNKYFLKTHKANKHGIYSMDTLVGPQGYGSPFFPSTISNSSSAAPTAAAAAAAIQMQQILQSSAGLTPTSEALVVSTPVRSNVVNMESYCEICQKEFCNKYFLKKHKQKIHGITDPNNPQQSSQQSSQQSHMSSSASPGSCSNEPQVKIPTPSPPLVSASLSLPISTTNSMASGSTPVITSSSSTPASERPLRMATPLMVSSQTSSPTNGFVCEICKQEFQTIISLQTHRFTTHYPAMHAIASVSSATSLQTMTASMAESAANRSAGGQASGQTGQSEPGNFVFTADKLREMGVINADAFCEICCKEFCNKYFLRTHKINKHGLSLDSNSSSKSQSGRNSNDNKGEDSNNDDNEDSFLEPGQRDPASYANGSDFFNAMSAAQSDLQCELCSRPFASHYLLRMHKFYSHNIPYIKEEDIRKSMATSPAGELPNDHKSDSGHIGRRGLETSGNGPAGQSSEGESNGAAETSADQASQDLQKLQTMIKELNSSSYLDKAFCHLCRQEFENKYFLRVHMMNDHGVIADEPSPLESSALMKSFLEVNRSQYPLVSSGLQTGDSQAFCDICQKDFCSKYFLKTHKQNMHGIYEGPPTPTESIPPTFPGQTSPHAFPSQRKSCDEAVNLAVTSSKDKSRQSLQLMSSKQMPPSMVAQSGQTSSESKPTGPRNPTGRNYCNICNKELCNKYFMKTHMLKMHGINIDEHPMEASANSTIGGVTCDICQKELCSKYFLKVHKQNTHGIYEEPPQPKDSRTSDPPANPSAPTNAERDTQAHGIDPNDTNNRYFSHYTEVCPLCERRFKSIKWLKTHMINDHSDIVSMRPTDLSITGPNADMNRLCILCGQTFSDRVALHIHLVKEHRTTAEELGISGNISGQKAAPISATDLSLKSEQIPIPLQLSQHMSSHQSAQSSRVNGSVSPLSQTTAGMGSAKSLNQAGSHVISHTASQVGSVLTKLMTIGSSAPTAAVPTTAIASIGNPVNSTNAFNTDPNNTINSNNLSTNNSNNNTDSEINSNTGVAPNPINASVITCAAVSTSCAATGQSLSSSPSVTTAAKEERSPSLLSNPLSAIISRRTGCGTRIYQCSYCNYSTRWLSNLYAHEKRHTRLNTEADKKFLCRVCHRAYRYNHSLQRHLLNHRAGGLNGRDVSAIALLGSNSRSFLSGGLHSGSDKFSGLDSKFSRLFPSGSHSSLHKALVGRTNRVKRYRCSKCNKKFRTRDLCLSHIQVYHSDSRKIILSSASGKVTTKVCRCSYCGFATRNFALLKIHINKTHHKLTTSPATDLSITANKGHDIPLNLRKSSETAANLSLSGKLDSAVSPTASSDEESMGGSGRRASDLASAESPQLPMTYAMPQSPPTAGSFIMQPFLITQPDAEGPLTNDTFVPSLVYLPVSHKVLQPVRVAFHLTPA